MKKISICFILAIPVLLVACETTTTNQHDNSGYYYKLNEEVQIVDKVSKDKLGTLKFTQYHILKDAPFTLRESDGEDENGNIKYKDVKYEQLIQLDYIYQISDSAKKPDSGHFACWDSSENYCVTNPGDIQYSPVTVDGGHFFVIAVPAKGDYIRIGYSYALLQVTGYTAQFKIEIKQK